MLLEDADLNRDSSAEDEVTYEVLFRALKKAIGGHMSEEEIKDLSYYVLNFFGFEGAVLDNILTPRDRDVFYMLEEAGILGTIQEEVIIRRGKLWRIHYWVLRKDNIRRLAQEDEDGDDESMLYSVYENLSDDMWRRK